jgi:N-acetylmuramoyl-L-alanine amidase-like protein
MRPIRPTRSRRPGRPARPVGSVALLSLLVPLATVLPVVSLPHASAHPVTPEVRSHALRGVEAGGRGAEAARSSSRLAARSWAAAPAGAANNGSGPGQPEVLVSRTGLAEFDLLGVTWRRTAAGVPDPAPSVLVRTHGDKGWSRWTALDRTPMPRAGEARHARPGTEPLWVGASDGYQVRVDTRTGSLPRDLRVDLIDPGSSAADADPTAGRPMQSAAAAAGQPVIYSRSQWGADEQLRSGTPKYSATIKTGFVHHTAGTNGYSAAEVPKILRAVYAYHVKGNGWSDVGYNFLVDRFGRLWEGRYGGITKAVIGAHTGGFNIDSFAVSALGNYDKVAPEAPMVDAIARLMAWKLGASFRDPNGTNVLTSEGGGTSRYSAGAKVTFNNISGHRDAGRTSCPGSNLYAQLANIRALTASYMGTAMYSPKLSSATAVYGTGSTVTVSARVNTDQQWRLEVRDACRTTVVRTIVGTASPSLPVSALWDLRDDTGTTVRPGAYSLSLVGSDAGGSTPTWVGTVTVNPARTVPPAVTAASPPGRTSFVPVDPIRLLDTTVDGGLPLGPGQRVDLRVPGAGRVPETGVAAVALNVSAGCATAATPVTVWATGSKKPSSAALNVPAGGGASAMTITALGGNGMVSVLNGAGTAELAVHVVGYYPVAGGDVFRSTKPLRLYDSRTDPAGPLAAGAQRAVTMPTLSGIPSTSMSGALLNVTALAASGRGSVTVQSAAGDRAAATVSYAPGRPVQNRAVARLADGRLTLTGRDATAHVVVDVVGWWAPQAVVGGQLFQPKAATRVLDTRTGLGARRGSVGPGGVLTVQVAGRGKPVPGSARAVVLNVTSLGATRNTTVTAWPDGTRRPYFPDLTVRAWRPTSNLVVIKVGARNRVRVANAKGSTHLVGDVVGYYP